MNNYNAELDKIYDDYSPMLYGIATALTPSKLEAEELLILTFQKIHQQKTTVQSHTFICVTLIKLILQTAHKHYHILPLQNKMLLSQFKSTPILYQLLCEQTEVSQYCNTNNLVPALLVKKMQEEFAVIKNFKINNN